MHFPSCCRHRHPPATLEEEEEAEGFGKRDIGLVGAIALTANNICGSGMSILPGMFQGVGWVVSTGLFLLVGAWTAASCLFISKTVASMPDNKTFRHRWEYTPLAKNLLPNWAFHTVLWVLAASFISQNISNVVASSQVMDSVLLAIAGRTCAFSFSGSHHNSTHTSGPFDCVSADTDEILTDSPFGSAYVISAGYAVTMLLTLPLSFFPLDDSIVVQVGGIVLVIGCVVLWAVQFMVLADGTTTGPLAPPPLHEALPAFGNSKQAFSQALSTVLFNYGFVSTIPSFLGEKAPTTSLMTTTIVSVVVSTALFLILGICGAIGGNWSSGLDILSFLADSRLQRVWKVSRICLYIFPAANLMTSIPVFSVIVRYNILQSGWKWLSGHGKLGMLPAHFISIGLPWILSIVFYPGDSLTSVMNWSSALLFVPINLLFPFWLYVKSRRSSSDSQAAANNTIGGGAGGGEATTTRLLEVEAPQIISRGPSSAALIPADDKLTSASLLLHAHTHAHAHTSINAGSSGSVYDNTPLSPPLSSLHLPGLPLPLPVAPNNEPVEEINPLVPIFCCCARGASAKTEYKVAFWSLWASLAVAVLAVILQAIATADPGS